MLAAPIKKTGSASHETQHNIKPYNLNDLMLCWVLKKCVHLFMLADAVKKTVAASNETQHNNKPYNLKDVMLCWVSKNVCIYSC
jgi:hypothetical protein